MFIFWLGNITSKNFLEDSQIIAALFIIENWKKNWKQPTSSYIEKLLSKPCDHHILEYYVAVKKRWKMNSRN